MSDNISDPFIINDTYTQLQSIEIDLRKCDSINQQQQFSQQQQMQTEGNFFKKNQTNYLKNNEFFIKIQEGTRVKWVLNKMEHNDFQLNIQNTAQNCINIPLCTEQYFMYTFSHKGEYDINIEGYKGIVLVTEKCNNLQNQSYKNQVILKSNNNTEKQEDKIQMFHMELQNQQRVQKNDQIEENTQNPNFSLQETKKDINNAKKHKYSENLDLKQANNNSNYNFLKQNSENNNISKTNSNENLNFMEKLKIQPRKQVIDTKQQQYEDVQTENATPTLKSQENTEKISENKVQNLKIDLNEYQQGKFDEQKQFNYEDKYIDEQINKTPQIQKRQSIDLQDFKYHQNLQYSCPDFQKQQNQLKTLALNKDENYPDFIPQQIKNENEKQNKNIQNKFSVSNQSKKNSISNPENKSQVKQEQQNNHQSHDQSTYIQQNQYHDYYTPQSNNYQFTNVTEKNYCLSYTQKNKQSSKNNNNNNNNNNNQNNSNSNTNINLNTTPQINQIVTKSEQNFDHQKPENPLKLLKFQSSSQEYNNDYGKFHSNITNNNINQNHLNHNLTHIYNTNNNINNINNNFNNNLNINNINSNTITNNNQNNNLNKNFSISHQIAPFSSSVSNIISPGKPIQSKQSILQAQQEYQLLQQQQYLKQDKSQSVHVQLENKSPLQRSGSCTGLIGWVNSSRSLHNQEHPQFLNGQKFKDNNGTILSNGGFFNPSASIQEQDNCQSDFFSMNSGTEASRFLQLLNPQNAQIQKRRRNSTEIKQFKDLESDTRSLRDNKEDTEQKQNFQDLEVIQHEDGHQSEDDLQQQQQQQSTLSIFQQLKIENEKKQQNQLLENIKLNENQQQQQQQLNNKQKQNNQNQEQQQQIQIQYQNQNSQQQQNQQQESNLNLLNINQTEEKLKKKKSKQQQNRNNLNSSFSLDNNKKNTQVNNFSFNVLNHISQRENEEEDEDTVFFENNNNNANIINDNDNNSNNNSDSQKDKNILNLNNILPQKIETKCNQDEDHTNEDEIDTLDEEDQKQNKQNQIINGQNNQQQQKNSDKNTNKVKKNKEVQSNQLINFDKSEDLFNFQNNQNTKQNENLNSKISQSQPLQTNSFLDQLKIPCIQNQKQTQTPINKQNTQPLINNNNNCNKDNSFNILADLGKCINNKQNLNNSTQQNINQTQKNNPSNNQLYSSQTAQNNNKNTNTNEKNSFDIFQNLDLKTIQSKSLINSQKNSQQTSQIHKLSFLEQIDPQNHQKNNQIKNDDKNQNNNNNDNNNENNDSNSNFLQDLQSPLIQKVQNKQKSNSVHHENANGLKELNPNFSLLGNQLFQTQSQQLTTNQNHFSSQISPISQLNNNINNNNSNLTCNTITNTDYNKNSNINNNSDNLNHLNINLFNTNISVSQNQQQNQQQTGNSCFFNLNSKSFLQQTQFSQSQTQISQQQQQQQQFQQQQIQQQQNKNSSSSVNILEALDLAFDAGKPSNFNQSTTNFSQSQQLIIDEKLSNSSFSQPIVQVQSVKNFQEQQNQTEILKNQNLTQKSNENEIENKIEQQKEKQLSLEQMEEKKQLKIENDEEQQLTQQKEQKQFKCNFKQDLEKIKKTISFQLKSEQNQKIQDKLQFRDDFGLEQQKQFLIQKVEYLSSNENSNQSSTFCESNVKYIEENNSISNFDKNQNNSNQNSDKKKQLTQISENFSKEQDRAIDEFFDDLFSNNKQENNDNENIITAQKMLDGSYVPAVVKNRDQESQKIKKFFYKCFKNEQEVRCLLLTGNPGTGKTLLTNHILNQISEGKLKLGLDTKKKQLRVLKFNGMNYKSACEFFKNVYYQLYSKQLTFQDMQVQLSKRYILDQIQNYFKNEENKNQEVIFMVDEFDRLFEGAGTDIFEIFGLINKVIGASIIGISNSIEMFQNLTEKFQIQLPKIRNIVFQPYERSAFEEIIQERINLIKCTLDIENNIFDPKAIKQCAGIVFNKGGDVRDLLDICKRTLQRKIKKINTEQKKEQNKSQINFSNLNFLKKQTSTNQLPSLQKFSSLESLDTQEESGQLLQQQQKQIQQQKEKNLNQNQVTENNQNQKQNQISQNNLDNQQEQLLQQNNKQQIQKQQKSKNHEKMLEILRNMSPITIKEFREVIDETYSNKKTISIIKSLPTLQQVILASLYNIVKKDQDLLEIKLELIQKQFNLMGKMLAGGIEKLDLGQIKENLKILEAYKILKFRVAKSRGVEKITITLDISIQEIKFAFSENQTMMELIGENIEQEEEEDSKDPKTKDNIKPVQKQEELLQNPENQQQIQEDDEEDDNKKIIYKDEDKEYDNEKTVNQIQEYQQYFTDVLENKCISNCFSQLNQGKNPPSSQNQFDEQIQPYIQCFNNKCGESLRQKFDDPNQKISKNEGSKVKKCYSDCKDKLDSKFYTVLENCKYSCFVDQSSTTSENVSSYIFLGILTTTIGFLIYQKKAN